MPRRNQGPRLRFLAKRGVYYIEWTEGGRTRQRSTGTPERENAEAFFAQWLSARQRRTGPRDPADVLVTDILADYVDERGPKLLSPDSLTYAVEALTGFWREKTVAKIVSATCEAYGKHRDRSAGTVRRELGVLTAAVNYAHKNGRLTQAIIAELPEAPEPRDRWLKRSEAAALLREALRSPQARFYLPLFILIGLYTGRRREAILSLRWCQIDLDANRIDFEKPGRRRSKKRRGLIPIPPRLKPHLVRARRCGSDVGHVIHINGRPIKDIKKGFAAACERAGLEGVTPHTLRHTAATWLAQNGVEFWEAAGFLSMTEGTLKRVYAHHDPDHQQNAAAAIGQRPGAVRRMSAE